MVVQEAQEAMAVQEAQEAMAGRPPWPWPRPLAWPLQPEPYYPPRKILGEIYGVRSPMWAKIRNRSPLRVIHMNWSPMWITLVGGALEAPQDKHGQEHRTGTSRVEQTDRKHRGHNSPLPEGVSHAVTVPPGRGGGRSGGPLGQTQTGTQDGDLQSRTDRQRRPWQSWELRRPWRS